MFIGMPGMVSVTGGRSVTSIDKIRRSDNVGVARLTWVPILGRRTPALRCRWSDRVLLEHERDWEALSSSLEVLDMDSSGAWLIRLRSFVGMEALRGTAGDGPPKIWGGVTARAYVRQYFAEILYTPKKLPHPTRTYYVSSCCYCISGKVGLHVRSTDRWND